MSRLNALLISVAGGLLVTSLADPVQASEPIVWRDLSPWIQDAIKIGRGMPAELDWDAPGAPTLSEIQSVLAGGRPTLSGPEELEETEHFVIHFTREGADAATEDQVRWSALSLEETWRQEIEVLGYPAPPSDGVRGGDGRYDVYWNKQIGTYGYCSGETFVDENSMTSYLALANWMGEKETYVTVAHEFFHSIHFVMDALEESWLFETSATWMEDMVYDDINDYYYYLDSVASAPETPITSGGGIMYGYAIWWHAITERFGPDIVRRIWEDASLATSQGAIESTQSQIAAAGDWNEALHDFRESLVDLSRFDEGDGYAAALGDGIEMSASVTKYPASGTGKVEGTGAHFVEFEATGSVPDALTVVYTGGPELVASLLVEQVEGEILEMFPDTEVGASGSFVVGDFGGKAVRAVLVVSHVGLAGSSSFSYSAEVPGWSDGSGCSLGGSSRSSSGWALLALAGLLGITRLRRRART